MNTIKNCSEVYYPEECLFMIFAQMDLEGLLTAQLVSTVWHRITLEPQIWKTFADSVSAKR